MTRCLLIVDVQRDFCEGGSLAVAGGAHAATAIADHVATAEYDLVVASRDWHVDPGDHFATVGEPDYATTWPVDCVAGTPGAEFHPNLDLGGTVHVDTIVSKGEHAAAYSAFDGATTEGDAFAHWVRAHDVTDLDVVGIATDHCVRATAIDAASHVGNVRVLIDLCAGVAPASTAAALTEMTAAGITIESS